MPAARQHVARVAAGTSGARDAHPSIAVSNAASSAHSGGAAGAAGAPGPPAPAPAVPGPAEGPTTRPDRGRPPARTPRGSGAPGWPAPRRRPPARADRAHPAPVRRTHRQPLQRDPRHQHVHRPAVRSSVAAVGQARQQLRPLARALVDQPEQVVQHRPRGAQMATLLQRPLHPRQEPRRAQRMQPGAVLRRDQVKRAAHGPGAHQAGGGHVRPGQARDARAQRQPRRADVLGLDPAHRACRLRCRARGGRRETGAAPPGGHERGPSPRVVEARMSARGEVAQLVEHTTENRGVAGSIPALAT